MLGQQLPEVNAVVFVVIVRTRVYPMRISFLLTNSSAP